MPIRRDRDSHPHEHLYSVLVKTGDQFPDLLALKYEDRCWTWAELVCQVEALADDLANAGVSRGDHIGLWLSNSPCFIFSYFAVLACGAVVVPFNPATRAGDYCASAPSPTAMITTPLLKSACQATLNAHAPNELPAFILCGDPDRCSDWKFETVNGRHRPMESASTVPALMQFSSGTTGRPKALYRTHSQCFAELTQFRLTCNVNTDDRIVGCLPLFHAHGMANTMWAAVSSGAALILLKNPQPFALQWQRALSILEQDRVTVFPGVPLMFHVLARSNAKADLPSLRLCFSAGSSLPREVFQEFFDRFGIAVRQLYGCTEAGAVAINLAEDVEESAGSVGTPMQGVRIQVIDDAGRECATGEIGTITFCSDALCDGYIGREMASAFYSSKCFRTSDLGFMNSSGQLTIVGRQELVAHVAGHKVFYNEVEGVITKFCGVVDVAVTSSCDAQTGESLNCYLVVNEMWDATKFDAFCRDQLPQHKRPKRISLLKELPKSALGKVARDQLR